jgi:hypothetical protein
MTDEQRKFLNEVTLTLICQAVMVVILTLILLAVGVDDIALNVRIFIIGGCVGVSHKWYLRIRRLRNA